MKKKILQFLIVVLIVAGGGVSKAQFEKGDLLFNAGISFGHYGWYHHNWSHYDRVYFPALQASIEKGFNEYIGIGAFGGYHSYYYRYTHDHKYYHRFNYITFGGVCSFHYSPFAEEVLEIILTDVDLYVSMILRLEVENYTYAYYDGFGNYLKDTDSAIFPRIGPVIGGRLYISDNLAIFGEVSYGGNLGFMTVGGTIRF